MPGSSPLARGLRQDLHPDPRAFGIIPARAGFTALGCLTCVLLRDHPRSRGVYRKTFFRQAESVGSSPLARGLLPPSCLPPFLRRIIPARAGFTRSAGRWRRAAADHPRSRGVYAVSRTTVRRGGGSSPLARGLRHDIVVGVGPRRIIPARAGFTSRRASKWRGPADHPRSRGVYGMSVKDAMGTSGSSPLARGLPALVSVVRGYWGIIPARAGFTRHRPA